MSQKDFRKQKEALLKKLNLSSLDVRLRVSAFSRREKSKLLQEARKIIQDSQVSSVI